VFDIQLPSDITRLVFENASLDEHLGYHELRGRCDTLNLLLQLLLLL
jgi:hypothetical protein